MQKKWLIVALGASLLINAVLVVILFKFESYRQCCLTIKSNGEDREKYSFLAPRIFVEEQNDILINFLPLRDALNEYVGKFDGKLGVYFEYLSSGNSIGVNDKMEVRLASLIKVPVVMAIYKQIEEGNLTKEQILTVKKDDLNDQFGDLWKKGAGTQLSVYDAIKLSLIESDNTAARTLTSILPQGAIDDVFDSLDIPKDNIGGLPIISPKNYSSILRSLYLSSFLSKENSNEILTLLTQTNFNDKLPAGVLPEVKVAHKIGIYDAAQIFSDCGIIYTPKRPYILCIMSKFDEETSRAQMVHLSKMVFGYVVQVNK